jgi:hypothetical protein
VLEDPGERRAAGGTCADVGVHGDVQVCLAVLRAHAFERVAKGRVERAVRLAVADDIGTIRQTFVGLGEPATRQGLAEANVG